jgi:hypothetical protein
MKVLKEGKWNIPWSGNATCPTCEAELLVEEADVKPTYNHMSYFCECAICGKVITLKAGDLPLRVKEAVDKKRKWSSSSDW